LLALQLADDQHHNQDVIYEHFAKRKFPLHLLDISLYEYSSWKTLLQDDNAKNGYYRLQLNAVSCSRNTGDQMFCYVNTIRSMAWDRKHNRIILEVKAFGENDLPKASRIAICGIDPTSARSFSPLHPLVTGRVCCENYENNGPAHQLCRIHIDANAFRPGHVYIKSYPAPSDRGRDCIACPFLPGDTSRSWPELFAKRKFAAELPPDHSRVPASGTRRCNFVSRSTPLRPSNILEWQGVRLPPAIMDRHGRGAWGGRPTSCGSHVSTKVVIGLAYVNNSCIVLGSNYHPLQAKPCH
jgi:hypothetical protein